MGSMHKEIITRKKAPGFCVIFIFLIFTLFLVQAIQRVELFGIDIGYIVSVVLESLIIVSIIFEIIKCKVKYKYFIVADQFIIHKMKGAEDKVVENIKIRNIEFMGKLKEYKANNSFECTKKYTCSLFNRDLYCCVYREGSKLKRFYFEPSSSLLEKINTLKQKRLAS